MSAPEIAVIIDRAVVVAPSGADLCRGLSIDGGVADQIASDIASRLSLASEIVRTGIPDDRAGDLLRALQRVDDLVKEHELDLDADIGRALDLARIARDIKRAAEHINAVQLRSGEYAYYAEEVDEWRVVSGEVLASFVDYLDDDDESITSDPYGHWCCEPSREATPEEVAEITGEPVADDEDEEGDGPEEIEGACGSCRDGRSPS